MMCLPLERQLEMERLLYGRDRRIAEPPPVLLELWERGRAAGYPLGRLYVLDAPLVPGVGGTYHRPSGDVWVHHDADAPDATVVRLLHEIGHAARRPRDTRHHRGLLP